MATDVNHADGASLPSREIMQGAVLVEEAGFAARNIVSLNTMTALGGHVEVRRLFQSPKIMVSWLDGWPLIRMASDMVFAL